MASLPKPLLSFLAFSLSALASPLHPQSQPRTIQSIGYIDPSTDEWSSTLSGIGPLILLIGERSTKQVLRNIRGPASAFSLAAAPLGLLSVVTSLIRFCGLQRLRAFLGYELEARTVAGMEVTRVNCGGVSAHLSDGYVVRSIVANPASRLIGVSFVEGHEKEILVDMAIGKIRAGERFALRSRKKGMPDGIVNSDWVMHIVVKDMSEEVLNAIALTLAEAVGVMDAVDELNMWRRNIVGAAESREKSNGDDDIRPVSPINIRRLQTASTLSTDKSIKENGTMISLRQTTTTTSEKPDKDQPFWDFTFMSTFDAVSEFTTSKPHPNVHAAAIGFFSFISIIMVHILALWQNDWIMSIGWILVMVGYLGIVSGVMLSAMIINSSSVCIKLNDKTMSKKSSKWRDGMVVAVKNTDSMDTTGSAFVSSPAIHQILEAVWTKPITSNDRLLASAVSIALVFAFIAHYLGLRATKWWASIGELGICITAAFARSISNDLQPQFTKVEGIKIDKRCMSTGIIRTQTSRIIDGPAQGLDARAYSLRALKDTPTVAERVAFQTAKLCQHNQAIRDLLSRITAMHLQIIRQEQQPHQVAVLASFTGGILFKEGLGFPSIRCALAFRSPISCLAAPTSLLARSIMRQPSWTLQPGKGVDIPLGNVYIFAIQSMLDWWTLSEDRNDMGDLQRNLHWPMFLINLAFFVEMMDGDKEVSKEVERLHEPAGEGDVKLAKGAVEYLGKWAVEDVQEATV